MRLKILILSLLVGLLAVTQTACNQGSGESRSDRTRASVELHWLAQTANVTAACQALGLKTASNGCARSKPGEAYICEIYAVEPRSFSDGARLTILGHELWHCLGATHPET